VLGDIAEERFRILRSMLPFRGLSVCLSVTFVHCAQTAKDIDTIFFAYDSPLSLPDRDKIWLTSTNPFPQILPQSYQLLLIWLSKTLFRWQIGIGAEWLEIAQWSGSFFYIFVYVWLRVLD